MGSESGKYDNTATFDFNVVAVVNENRIHEKKKATYTNLRCDNCKEWWIMICLDQKKVWCPWCGAKCKVKNL